MIIPMRKVTLVAQRTDCEAMLAVLQSVGVLHVQQQEAPPTSAEVVAARSAEAARARAMLADAPKHAEPEAPAGPLDARTVLGLFTALADARHELAAIERELATFAPFGPFDPARIARLREHGLFVELYACYPEQMPDVPPGVGVVVVHRDKSQVHWVAVARAPLAFDLPELPLPARSTAATAARRDELRGELDRLQRRLAGARQRAGDLRAEQLRLADELLLAQARDQVGGSALLATLQGFCPVDAVGALQRAAAAHGWGLIVGEPAAEDLTPTLIRNPRWSRPIETVFGFIETFPGYRERDISGVFLVFFSLFYAILIGDAAYGAVFLAILIGCHLRFGDRFPKQPLHLLYTLNLTTLAWGVLTGSYFGIALAADNPLRSLVLIDTADQKFVQIVCFTIGVVHLSLAHAWNAFAIINSVKAVAEVGWLLIVWACYFLANSVIAGQPFPDAMYYVGGLGLVLALFFSGSLTSVSDLCQFPFKIINSFGDIASYLRLFAVGSASAALAQVFNGLALSVGAGGPVAKFGMVLILVLGHGLNLVLGPLSVLVHGLRLNLLEFSGHLGQEWTGVRYRPLSCKTTSTHPPQGDLP
ncbi:MAG: hypothetical protein FJ265_06430 [Planctomycetes bacterium]|nr:hypothetical protein [Planctomycetota bacterium]